MSEPHLDPQLNAYLDGDLTADEAAAFEARMAHDPALRAAADRLRDIESQLAVAFPAAVLGPDPRDLTAAGPLPLPMPARSVTFRAAAAVLLLVGAASILALTLFPALGRPEPIHDSFLYGVVTSRFTPDTVCDTPEKFLDYTADSLSQPITADFALAADRGITLVGWTVFGGAYDEEGRKRLPKVLLALGPTGERHLVYFQDRGHAPPIDDPANTIAVYSKRLGRVTAYEVSNDQCAEVIDLLGLAP